MEKHANDLEDMKEGNQMPVTQRSEGKFLPMILASTSARRGNHEVHQWIMLDGKKGGLRNASARAAPLAQIT